jgi:hypothetical protein
MPIDPNQPNIISSRCLIALSLVRWLSGLIMLEISQAGVLRRVVGSMILVGRISGIQTLHRRGYQDGGPSVNIAVTVLLINLLYVYALFIPSFRT